MKTQLSAGAQEGEGRRGAMNSGAQQSVSPMEREFWHMVEQVKSWPVAAAVFNVMKDEEVHVKMLQQATAVSSQDVKFLRIGEQGLSRLMRIAENLGCSPVDGIVLAANCLEFGTSMGLEGHLQKFYREVSSMNMCLGCLN